jgi:DNA invertase Pin-like site-specific DNA recombinase
MLIGYARVSKKEQNLDRQIDALVAEGVDARNIYQEKMTGKKLDRREFTRMITELQANDAVIVAELTRIARSTMDLLRVVQIIEAKQAHIKSIKESWLDTTTAAGRLMLTIFAGLAQFERDLISERTIDGLKAAKARGRVGGRPSLRSQLSEIVEQLYVEGKTINEIAKQTSVSRSTIKRILQAMRAREGSVTAVS